MRFKQRFQELRFDNRLLRRATFTSAAEVNKHRLAPKKVSKFLGLKVRELSRQSSWMHLQTIEAGKNITRSWEKCLLRSNKANWGP